MRSTVLVLLAIGCAPGAASVDDPRHPTDPGVDPTAPESTVTTAPEPTTPPAPTDPGPAPDYAQPGPYAVASSSGTLAASCDLPWVSYFPVDHDPAALVVLAHGYLSTKEGMRGHAEHFASWGLAVVAPDLCHLELLDLDFDANAADLIALGQELGHDKPIVHAGHSFGGLSSFLAAGLDPDCIGHVALDLTDNFDVGENVAAALPVPSWATFGEPERCNQSGNGTDLYPLVADARSVHVVGADHCDFENPIEPACSFACASGSGDDQVVATTIEAMITSAALALSGEDPRGAEYWTPGAPAFEALADAGAITVP